MRVALVKPRNFRLLISKGTVRIPLGLAYIAAACEADNHDVMIFDTELMDGDEDQICRDIAAFSPDLVGFTATTPLLLDAYSMSKKLHCINQNIKTIIGGPHVTYMAQDTMKNTDFDYACLGEGEEAVPALLKAIENGVVPDGIPGIIYKTEDGSIKGNFAKAQCNIHKAPLPARRLLDLKQYIDIPRNINEPQDMVFTARGCPEECAFCISADERLRIRYTEDVLKELDDVIVKHGTKFLIIGDDTFTQHKRKTIELCKAIVDREYNIRYICQTRLDRIDSEILEWLMKSGCYAVCFGIESGSDRVLQSMRKHNDIAKIKQNVPLIKSFGFNMRATYIIGWIDETEDEIEATIRLAEEINADESAFCIATPYPGTELWNEAVRRGMSTSFEELSKFHYYKEVGFNMSKVSDERLLELQQEAYKRVPSRVYRVSDA
jgi:radical SAM superfamily enzyme YgiQ (UPF0313 family)